MVLYVSRAAAYLHLRRYDQAWADVHQAESLGLTVDPKFLAALRRASGRNQ